MHMPTRRQQGFSLLEMAVVLVILGLLLGGMLSGVSAMRASQQVEETRHRLEEIREALIAFAIVNRRLPCPANPATADTVAGAGIERTPTVTGCTGGTAGVVPWATLGLPQTDVWGHRFSYRVSPAFVGLAPVLSLLTTGDNTVRNRAGVSIALQVPAVVVSHGANGAGGRSHLGTLVAVGSDPGQQENADGDNSFVADTVTDAFDDEIVWVPPTLLIGKLLQAGILP